ncbi:DUF4397 domain-containing protein [Actinophytocola oryzae]|uniref:Uncharacterized protein DUF4397 n=1 Tax=Actinophytocola oryzae TaxID=502181 RepID=A0A4R7V696_9PSEU|nr:DUF4397 domain-containing protein [Actinophytocola oryzae]TDV44292.1 uncharacterized protein DUF4397 [Actinophytocola oryzae]
MRNVMVKLGVLACALAAFAVVPVPASAQTGAYLRLAHLSPDTPSVDVTVSAFSSPDGSQLVKGVSYGDVSAYQQIAPGTYTIAMRPAGADPKSDPVISATLDAVAGRAYTVAGLGKFSDLALRVLDDDISLPVAGQARMRVVNAAPLTGMLSVRRDATPVIENAAFGDASKYTMVPSGAATLTVAPADAAATTLPVTLEAGGVYTVLVLQRNGVLSAAVRLDARGTAVVPNGGVETGFGGTAGPDLGVGALLLGIAAAAGGVLVLATRRRRAA